MKWFKRKCQSPVQKIPTEEFWSAVLRVLDAYSYDEYDRYSKLPETERFGHVYESWRIIGTWLNRVRNPNID